MIWLLCLLLSVAEAKGGKKKSARQPAKPKSYMTKVEACTITDSPKKVLLIKQWHLPPTTITKGFKEKYPHEKNQTAIYQRLDQDIKRKDIDLVVAEGCEGEINSEFATAFNGWDYSALKVQSQRKGYEKIVSHVPLKIEAKHTDKILTFCGDNKELIQEGNLRLSNLRGWMGFWVRLKESKDNPDKFKLYSSAAIDLLKAPKDIAPDKLMAQIHARIREELSYFQKSLADRNDNFVKVLKDKGFTTAAVVIGGLHAHDLKTKIQAAGLNCEVLEPNGYSREDEKLIEEFTKTF